MPTNLAENLYHVKGSFGSNIYLVTDNGLTLIDAGFPVDLPCIHLGLRGLGARPRDINLMVATHYHGDHVGTMAGIKRRYGTRIAMYEEDVPFACGERPYERFEVATSRLVFYTFLWPFFRYRHFSVDRSLRDGDALDILGGLEVVHTPGHTVGSICLYNREKKILFSGDLIRNENGVMEGPPPQFTPDPAAAVRSLHRIADYDFDILLPGHGYPILASAGPIFRDLYRDGKLWPLSEKG
ncbi:MAG: MBL fold metallo-hydrolase [Actinomycetota bacterium]|nr:MBL fold metallo-hydrolase [Actinomycetota bacterium]